MTSHEIGSIVHHDLCGDFARKLDRFKNSYVWYRALAE